MKNVVLWNAKEVNYCLIARLNNEDKAVIYVCAWNYNEANGWSQGHYFETLLEAVNYMQTIYKEQGKEHLLREREV